MNTRWSIGLETAFAGIGLLGLLLLSGCGPSDEDACADKTCELGTCDPGSGSCVNTESCNVSSDCIAGYQCSGAGACLPVTNCEGDGDCETGVCDGNACVNPDSCTENGDCLPKTYCDTSSSESGGTCEADPCNDVRCPRGVCERGVGECVSKESCSKETETFDCVSGEKCADGTCVSNENFCDELTCDRGTCSLEEGGCVNPDECEADEECLAEYFCNDMNQCQPNRCERQNIDCGEEGECQPKSGQCENPKDCNSNSQCLSNHICIDGTCRLTSSACGDASGDGGCPGNQKCDYDPEKRKAECLEPDRCETSLDCKKNRRCSGQTCLKPESCDEDRFEDNDAADSATTFGDAASAGTLRASVCSGDSDFYEVDTTEIAGGSMEGTLVVALDVPLRDRGLGKATVELVDSDDTSHGTDSTGAMGADGAARVTKQMMSSDHGTYTIEVSPGDDINKAGVDYDLSVHFVPSETINACENASEITVNQRTSGTTESANSSALGSSCTSTDNSAAENIYEIQVDRPQELQFELSPSSDDANLTMSLRRRCLQQGSELACATGSGPGGDVSMKRIVGPGTYYLVVQSTDGGTGGEYGLMVRRVFTTCSADGNYCDAEGNAHSCTSDGGRFRTLECDDGCDRARGRCICDTKDTIDPANAQQRMIDLGQATADYEVSEGQCLGSGDTQSSGSDVIYEVVVPRRNYVRFEAIYADDGEGSMYLIGDCSDVDRTCKKGVKNSTSDADREVLEYTNISTGASERLYLVVDSDSNNQPSSAELQIDYKQVQCPPGGVFCDGSSGIAVCSDDGVDSTAIGQCASSCSGGTCQDKVTLSGSILDDCSNTVNVAPAARQSGGITFSGKWGDFSNKIEASVCSFSGPGGGIGSFDTGDNESVYQLDLRANETVDASVDGGNGDVSIWLKGAGDCGTSDVTCLAGEEKESPTASLNYQASSAETTYLLIDREGSSGSDTFELDITIK